MFIVKYQFQIDQWKKKSKEIDTFWVCEWLWLFAFFIEISRIRKRRQEICSVYRLSASHVINTFGAIQFFQQFSSFTFRKIIQIFDMCLVMIDWISNSNIFYIHLCFYILCNGLILCLLFRHIPIFFINSQFYFIQFSLNFFLVIFCPNISFQFFFKALQILRFFFNEKLFYYFHFNFH